MGCKTVSIPGGGTAVVCSRGRRTLCATPMCSRPSVSLCDYPVERNGKKATCDRHMCERHRHTIEKTEADSIDWCEAHWNSEQKP